MIRVLVIGAVLTAAAGVAGWALAGFAGRVHERAEAGKGNAIQAPGSPVPPVWPQDRATDITYRHENGGHRG